MKIVDLPFGTVDWDTVERTTHAGQTGEAMLTLLKTFLRNEVDSKVIVGNFSGDTPAQRMTPSPSLKVPIGTSTPSALRSQAW